jgi:Putative Zn-dependent protease, contains TPR repeats
MNPYSRRKFLRSLLLGSGGLILLSTPGKVFATSQSENKVSKKILLEQARLSFYKREYENAEYNYRQLIKEYPADIVGYDGLAKVYNVRQYKLAIVKLYEQGLDTNPDNPVFYDRLARSIGSLSLGDKKQEEAYIKEKQPDSSLIEYAVTLYMQAIALAPDKKYLYDGLMDSSCWLNKKNIQLQKRQMPPISMSEEITSRMNSMIPLSQKTVWEESRKSIKGRGKTTGDVAVAMQKLQTKPRRELYFEDEMICREKSLSKKSKEFIYPCLFDAISNDNQELAKDYFKQIKSVDQKETHAFSMLSKYYKKKKYYSELENLYGKENSHSSLYWNTIKQAQTLFLVGSTEKNNSKKDQAFRMLEESLRYMEEQDIKDTKAWAAVYLGMGEYYTDKSLHQQCRSVLLQGIKQIPGTSGFSTALIIDYAKSYEKEGNAQVAEKILLCLSEEKADIVADGDSFMNTYFQKRNRDIKWMQENKVGRWSSERKRKRNKFNRKSSPEKLKASYVLAKLYERQSNQTRYGEVLSYIEKEDSQNEFAKRRRKRYNHN